jgi:hypothetical protein
MTGTSRQRMLAFLVGLALVTPLALGAWSLNETSPTSWADGVGADLTRSGPDDLGVDSQLALMSDGAPFRLSGRPSGVAYDPLRSDPQLTVPPSGPPRPALALSGIVYGLRSAALIEGIPGRERAVALAVGDTLGGISVRRIAADHVVLTGFDTTWTLAIRRPW